MARGGSAFIAADIAAGRQITPVATRLPGGRSEALLTAHRPRTPQVETLRSWLLSEAPGESTARGPDRRVRPRLGRKWLVREIAAVYEENKPISLILGVTELTIGEPAVLVTAFTF
jgi:hypothetical protein